ncbi:MAG: DUF2157 domain-containing protein [Proteobacteria bacterium]|nr:DUF2157 domain-containing protein [Pseudomonadota bacterium]
MFTTHRQLQKDIARWQASGWITPDGADAIRADLSGRRSVMGLAGSLSTLAAVLVGAAVLSFVAANWQEMPKLARLGIIFAGLWGAFAGAAWLEARNYKAFAEAALLAGVAMFGGGIMLIAQMYHMDGHPPDAVLLWGIGGLITGWLTRSNWALAAALAIFCVWSAMETIGEGFAPRIHWPFLVAWTAVATGFFMTGWVHGVRLLSVTLAGWILFVPYCIGDARSTTAHALAMLVGGAWMGAGVLLEKQQPRFAVISDRLIGEGFLIAFIASLGLQFVTRPGTTHTLLFGAIVLAGVVGVLWWAWQSHRQALLKPAYGAFAFEVFALYVKKIGTLLGTSAFFLIAGLLVAALAWAAMRLHVKSTAATTRGTP